MDATTAYERRDEAFLLDVRQPGEWVVGHIDGSVLLPMDQLAARQEELPTDQPIVVVCRTGNRSGMVTRALVNAGYDAHNLDGGLKDWAGAGLPLVTDNGSPGAVA